MTGRTQDHLKNAKEVPAERPQLTLRLLMHARGPGHTLMAHEIAADGERTGITRTKTTNGSPDYLRTSDELDDGGDVFNVLEHGSAAALEWIYQRLAARAEEE